MNKLTVIGVMFFVLSFIKLAEELYIAAFVNGCVLLIAFSAIILSTLFTLGTLEAGKTRRETRRRRETRYRNESKINEWANYAFLTAAALGIILILADITAAVLISNQGPAFSADNVFFGSYHYLIMPFLIISCYLSKRRPRNIKVQ